MSKEIQSFKNVGVGELLDWDYGFFDGTKEEYAKKLGLPMEMVKNLFDNKVVITDDIADRIEKVTGCAKYIIFKMDKDYRERAEQERIAKKSKPVYKSAQSQSIKEM